MNDKCKYLNFPLLMMLFISNLLCGQSGSNNILDEKVTIVTDRTLYISGENIKFSAILQTGNDNIQPSKSVVLYCELITPGGGNICGNKYFIKDNFSSGSLIIPDDIPTGIYYLKAYTKFMRNRGPLHYNYTIIKVINVNRSEIQQTAINPGASGLMYKTVNPGTDTVSAFKIMLNKSGYKRRESVNLIVEGGNTGQSHIIGLSLAVIPEYTLSTDREILPEAIQQENEIFYFPETMGPSVTGKLTDISTETSVRNARINLSVMGKQKDFMAQLTDSSGRFFFSMPEFYGYHDIFLCTDESNHSILKILVDNDFCKTPVDISSPIFSLTPGEHEIAYQMAVNLQIGSYFSIGSPTKEKADTIPESSFYGVPSDIIYIDKYVDLPTLEEYFNSLPSLVRVRKNLGKKYFKITGTNSVISDLDPLVLIDMVAIDEPSKVLAISPVNISRIEVVNSLYVKGDQRYGGIINIVTKKGDFGGIDLPSSGIFINYCFLSEKGVPAVDLEQLPNRPDARNTLYWEPRLVLDNQNIAKVTFPTSDTPGKFLIVLSWTDIKGKINRKISEFEVLR